MSEKKLREELITGGPHVKVVIASACAPDGAKRKALKGGEKVL